MMLPFRRDNIGAADAAPAYWSQVSQGAGLPALGGGCRPMPPTGADPNAMSLDLRMQFLV